jgi:cyanophycinase
MSAPSARGTLILIGGREDKERERLILSEVARRAGRGTLVVGTMASAEPEYQWRRYQRAFTELGVGKVAHLGVAEREDALDARRAEVLDDATAVFFTGGDQLQIVAKLGGTAILTRLRELFEGGGLVAGTSAGAAAMGEVMLVARGARTEPHKVRSAFYMTRGLGLVSDLIIDQHFAQRARIHRLLGAVGENPGVLGIGIDEDTAVVVQPQHSFEVIGSGAVYVVDGSGLTHTNVSAQASRSTLCLFDVTLHILNEQSGFDLVTRRPYRERPAAVEETTALKTDAMTHRP